mmetsp:Transcript_14890/g.16842  ORF Transcript_14890/g.16842 Transcript_14890/m.16842 type:complete len:273 (-) Transcript_14890:798-1616(-)
MHEYLHGKHGYLSNFGHFLCLSNNFFYSTNKVERTFWKVVVLAFKNSFEVSDGLFKVNKLSFYTGKYLCYSKRLGHKSLDFSSACNNDFIFFRKLIHTKDSNDILKRFVILKNLLYTTSNFVVFFSNNTWVKDTRGGVKWVYRWVDSQFCNRTGKYSGCIQVSEGCSWSWICKIISWYVDSLYRGNRSLCGGSNTLLKSSQICCQSWLVSYSGWDTSKKRRHFRTCLGKSKDVINKQKYILSLVITKVFSDSQSSKSYTSASTRWFIHLTVH